jgi:hypothetical protein
MDFLKKLFGGGGATQGDKDGIYFYVKAEQTGEVIQVRLNKANDLSLAEGGGGYYTRKLVVGQRSFDRIEAEFFFDKNRRFTSAEIAGGELVDRDAYDAYLASEESDD